jgi:flagellar motor switch protein FliN/FliY
MTESQGKAQHIELPELGNGNPAGPAILAGNPAVLDSVKVGLTVVVGQAQTTLGELMALKQGVVLKADRAVDTPVDVVINGNVVARGSLVAVDDHFGVRITEVAAHKA